MAIMILFKSILQSVELEMKGPQANTQHGMQSTFPINMLQECLCRRIYGSHEVSMNMEGTYRLPPQVDW